ncbi:MAG: dihydroorotate dehydrogenase [Clostridia bacterium]|nr:dihydroorotate dehydrogenase [Clostridia bacterium]MBO5299643.1 dihydroorotate dehydrogenase [Clostridia bacterium]
MDLSVNIAGVTLKNPIITASGTCGFGREMNEIFPISELGALAGKGMTLLPKEGNDTPRIAETPSGMLNAVGLQNPGVDYYIEHELPFMKQAGATVIANIAGSTIEDYVEIAKRISPTDTDMVEMNISCPNVKNGGLAFGTDAKIITEITRRVKDVLRQPLIVKLSPNVTSITDMALAAESAGADAVSLINTLLGMRIDIKTGKPILANTFGGLSGPAVLPVAIRMVYQVSHAVKIPVIGMGGIMSAENVLEFMYAGASAVMVGTASLIDPAAPYKILKDYEKLIESRNM